jgi:hypothetical protein
VYVKKRSKRKKGKKNTPPNLKKKVETNAVQLLLCYKCSGPLKYRFFYTVSEPLFSVFLVLLLGLHLISSNDGFMPL